MDFNREKEILRKQLELLSENSQRVDISIGELTALSDVMFQLTQSIISMEKLG